MKMMIVVDYDDDWVEADVRLKDRSTGAVIAKYEHLPVKQPHIFSQQDIESCPAYRYWNSAVKILLGEDDEKQ